MTVTPQTHSTFKAGSETHAPMIAKFGRAIICLRVSVNGRYHPLSVLRESLETQFTLRDIPFKTGSLNMRLGQNDAADLREVLPASGHPSDLAPAIDAAMVPDFVIDRNNRPAIPRHMGVTDS